MFGNCQGKPCGIQEVDQDKPLDGGKAEPGNQAVDYGPVELVPRPLEPDNPDNCGNDYQNSGKRESHKEELGGMVFEKTLKEIIGKFICKSRPYFSRLRFVAALHV